MYQTDVTYYLDQILDNTITKKVCLEFISKYQIKTFMNSKEIKINWNLLSLTQLKEIILNLINNNTNIVHYNKEGVQNEIC